ncbi:MAG: thiamine phosphate synthase [Desulfosarcinaceae bacterium]
MDAQTMRMLDANFNRVAEGLRVAEDIFRFCFDQGDLQARLKGVRHRLMVQAPAEGSERWRQALCDVGFRVEDAWEKDRNGTRDLLRANFKRAQQGLRCLEELFKLHRPSAAREIKALRYEVYDIEGTGLAWIERPRLGRGLYLILTEPDAGYRTLARMAVAAGVPAIQLRYKGDDMHRCLSLAKGLREITKETRTLLIVNDRPDVALLADADGIHLGQSDLPVKAARRLIGPRKLLGLSTHNLDQVRRAANLPVDYIGFGPLYPTASKANPDPATGLGPYLEARRICVHPVVALGGLNPARLARLGTTACPHPAMIGAVAKASDPQAAMRTIQDLYTEKKQCRH